MHDEPLKPSALQTLMQDAEVQQWLKAMGAMAFLPVKR
jgi:hypothetical protein